MTTPIRRAADVTLFVLDDSGVFFAESRQEIHGFNTAATYIWCCIEEGLARRDIVAAFGRAFAIANAEAERHVGGLLHRWQGLGYISGVDGPPPVEIDFTTALGRLLVNPSLREEMARSASDTARRLGVRRADLETFVSLDTAAIERQAQVLLAKKAARRRRPAAARRAFPVAATPRDRGAFTWARERHYRLVTTNFRLRFASDAQETVVHTAFVHLEHDPQGQSDVTVEIVEDAQGHLVLCDGDPFAHCNRLDELAPAVKSTLRQVALNRFDYFVAIHAGAVERAGRCVLLPAAPGSGKTTLTGALIRSGFGYLTDELSLLEENTLRLRPVSLALAVKPGAIDALTPYYPALNDLPAHRREDNQLVRYLTPPEDSLTVTQGGSVPVGTIVFPRYDGGGGGPPRPLARADALDRLLRESLILPKQLEKTNVRDLVGWMRKLDCYELPISSLANAVEAMKTLCR